MSVVIVIPARFASTRLPEKMLLAKTNWPLIRHTYEQAKKATLAERVLIATDHERIFETIKSFGGEVVMTSKDHPTGSDRLAEVAEKYLSNEDIIINVQGDEPEIAPKNIDHLIELFQASHAEMATLVTPFKSNPLEPNSVKAVLGPAVKHKQTSHILGYQALYFSRSIIPYPRASKGEVINFSDYYHHLGIFAYKADFLKKYVTLPQGRLELAESLEQLRLLEYGYKIVAGIVEHATPGIDSQEDYNQFVNRFYAQRETNEICA
ncbi:MAG: 3-deoxy-manno-octulosonate cytidylyltransferase [Candidatus Berkiellales bacterium]